MWTAEDITVDFIKLDMKIQTKIYRNYCTKRVELNLTVTELINHSISKCYLRYHNHNTLIRLYSSVL